MTDTSQFQPTERRLVASFPVHLAGRLRADRSSRERRAQELVLDLLAMQRECLGGGGLGVAGGFASRLAGAAARFDPTKISGCVLDVDPGDSGTVTLTSASITDGSDFSSGAWNSGANVTTIANDTTAPDGTTTADRLTSTSTSGDVAKNQSIANASITTGLRDQQIYVKRNNVDWFAFGSANNMAHITWFNINAGTVGTTTGVHSNVSITSVGNGWWRIRLTVTSSVAAVMLVALVAGDGLITGPTPGQYLWAWGASVEESRYSAVLNRASGVPVSQSTVTNQPLPMRFNGDAARPMAMRCYNVHGISTTESAPLTSFQNSNPQTAFCAVSSLSVSGAAAIVGGYTASNAQPYRFMVGRNNALDFFEARPDVGADVLVNSSASWALNTPYVKEVTYSGTHVAMWSNGTSTLASTAAATGTTTLTRVSLGAWGNFSSSNLIGWLGRCVVHSRVLSAAERSYVRVGLGNQWGIAVTP